MIIFGKQFFQPLATWLGLSWPLGRFLALAVLIILCILEMCISFHRTAVIARTVLSLIALFVVLAQGYLTVFMVWLSWGHGLVSTLVIVFGVLTFGAGVFRLKKILVGPACPHCQRMPLVIISSKTTTVDECGGAAKSWSDRITTVTQERCAACGKEFGTYTHSVDSDPSL